MRSTSYTARLEYHKPSDERIVSPECDRSKEEVKYISRRVELFRSFPLLALDPILVDQTKSRGWLTCGGISDRAGNHRSSRVDKATMPIEANKPTKDLKLDLKKRPSDHSEIAKVNNQNKRL